MSDSFLRQWAILRHMPRYPRKLATRAFVDHLENLGFICTKRTVERDLVKLSKLWPIYSDIRNKPYGWQWAKNAEVMDIPGMDLSGALAFRLAQEYLMQLLPPQTLSFLEPHFQCAGSILKQAKSGKLALWPDKVRVIGRGPDLVLPKVSPEVHDAVFQALLEDKQIDACYQPRDSDRVRDYVINPLGAVFRGGVVYLVGTLWDYTDLKQFSLHRFKSARIGDAQAIRPKGFSLDSYIGQGEFSYPVSSKHITLQAVFDSWTAQHLYETPLSPNQKLTPRKDGRILLKAAVLDTAELRWWLLGFGSGVEVLSPKRLREEFRSTAKQLAGMYT